MSLGVVPACPVNTDRSAPTPDRLAYSLTLPAALTTPALARAATRAFLYAHDLDEMLDPALQGVSELVATACQFTYDADVYVSLRYRDDALRVTTYDHHPTHINRHLVAACDSRRRAALRLLACVARACGGDWGYGPSREAGGGTRMWLVLPRHSGAAYGRKRSA
ncbi:ATP-binding protein [Streptomyces kunmingensis]|uniref:ATP-binding protein n=1 Tax=Streptomyces kunmingensis TaxID=68225 RepID=A0ABU6CJI2_9ACTN|nr:ATP-binding protein [Streptomyces kunmingensis]MEB3964055.1 ATP-binding protein [Streptomyces kunmingensis]